MDSGGCVCEKGGKRVQKRGDNRARKSNFFIILNKVKSTFTLINVKKSRNNIVKCIQCIYFVCLPIALLRKSPLKSMAPSRAVSHGALLLPLRVSM